MPNAFRLLTPSERIRWNSELYLPTEKIHLFMPSEIEEPAQRELSCVEGLSGLEAELRRAEAHEATLAIEGSRSLHAVTVRKKKGGQCVRPKGKLRTLERKVRLEKDRLEMALQAIEHLNAIE
jgi:hypothetical protein